MNHPLRYILLLAACVAVAWFGFGGKIALTPPNEHYEGPRAFSQREEVALMLRSLYNGLIDQRAIGDGKTTEQKVWSVDLARFAEALDRFYPAPQGGFVTPARVYSPHHFARVRGHWLNDTYLNLELDEGDRFDSFSGEAVPAGTRIGLEGCDVKRRNPRGATTEQLIVRGIRCEFAQRLRTALFASPPSPSGGPPANVDAREVVTALTNYVGQIREKGAIERFETDLQHDQVRIWFPNDSTVHRVYVFPYLVNPYPDTEAEELSVLSSIRSAVSAGALVFSARERILSPVALDRDKVQKALRAAAELPDSKAREDRFFEVLSPKEELGEPYVGVFPNGEFRFHPFGYETSPRDPKADGVLLKRVREGKTKLGETTENSSSKDLFCYEIPYGETCCEMLREVGSAAGYNVTSMNCEGSNFSTSLPNGELSTAPTVERTCRGLLNDVGDGECLLIGD